MICQERESSMRKIWKGHIRCFNNVDGIILVELLLRVIFRKQKWDTYVNQWINNIYRNLRSLKVRDY